MKWQVEAAFSMYFIEIEKRNGKIVTQNFFSSYRYISIN